MPLHCQTWTSNEQPIVQLLAGSEHELAFPIQQAFEPTQELPKESLVRVC
jgi:hypothetical protein